MRHNQFRHFYWMLWKEFGTLWLDYQKMMLHDMFWDYLYIYFTFCIPLNCFCTAHALFIAFFKEKEQLRRRQMTNGHQIYWFWDQSELFDWPKTGFYMNF